MHRRLPLVASGSPSGPSAELEIASTLAGVADSLPFVDADPVELVRSGYNAVSFDYRGDDDLPGEYEPWLAALQERIPRGARVLDIGCGCGIPVARWLVAAGHMVTGVDISDVQVERARHLVPGAVFFRADATDLDFPPGSFDAVVCLYALIHMPLGRQPLLLRNIARWLRPGGWLLVVAGQDAWTGTEDNWLGGGAPMWWSQADAATYREWLTGGGLQVTGQQFVPEGDVGHALFWARLRPADPAEPASWPRPRPRPRPPPAGRGRKGENHDRHPIAGLANRARCPQPGRAPGIPGR